MTYITDKKTIQKPECNSNSNNNYANNNEKQHESEDDEKKLLLSLLHDRQTNLHLYASYTLFLRKIT